MRLLAVFPPHIDPAAVAGFVGSALGDRWEVAGTSDPSTDALEETEVIFAALQPVTAEHIDSAASLKLIQTPSHGYDHVDVDAAARAGIPVCNVGTSGAEAANVAEHAFGLMLACSKRLVEGHLALTEGRWANQELLRAGMTELRGKTLGIVGLGQIGREVAKRGAAFDMTVLYHDVVEDADAERTWGVRRVPLDELLAQADVVSVHVPLLPSTRGLIAAAEIAKMKPRAILVNTSRGAVVDAGALAEALHAGKLRAGIDVFEPEPPPPDHPLLTAPDVVLSPHVAGVTNESVARIMAEAIENVRRFERGEPLRDIVNGVGR